jgi:hypothetical protein
MMEIELKILESMPIFDFRKLNKISRGGIKIKDFA